MISIFNIQLFSITILFFFFADDISIILTAFNTVSRYNTVYKNIYIIFNFHINIVFQDILKKSVFDVK